MAATRDIVATYRGPGRVVRRLLGDGAEESRLLIYLMLGCGLVFVAQTPRLARQAFQTGQELNMLLGGTLVGWIFIMPLVFYILALLVHLVAKPLGTALDGFGSRLALFWALLASSPVMLLWGLTAGFVGPGREMNIVGILWLIVFFWFWIAGLFGAAKGASDAG